MVFTSRRAYLITGFFVLLLGIGLIAGGIIYTVSANRKLTSWTHVYAEVVSYEKRYERDDDGFEELKYYDIVEYKVDGKSYRATSLTSSNIRPTLGTSREIAYNPDNPAESVFADGSVSITSVLLFVCGGAFIIGGVLVFITYGKKSK